MSAKAKKQSACVPQSFEEARAMMLEFGNVSNMLVKLEADTDAVVAKAKDDLQTAAKPFQDRLNALFEGLETWAAANRKTLTDDGRTKQVKMGVGVLGWRLCPPSVKWARGFNAEKILDAIDSAIEALRDPKMRSIVVEFIRTKSEPNKEAMLAHPDVAALVEGVKIVSGIEEFYVDPTQTELAEAKS